MNLIEEAQEVIKLVIGDVTCTAKVNPRTTARPGDEVEFAMDVARLHVFDKETEMVITH